MTIDYFEELLKKPSIFKDESKLDINFTPERLPHREKEISLLSQLFLALLTNPNNASRKVLVTGKTGVGKTVTVKLFGEVLKDAAKKRAVSITYVHINCRKEQTSYKVLIKIARSVNKNFPKRGYSPQDLLEIVLEQLDQQNSHLLLVLDELNYLIDCDKNLIYSLTRLNEDSQNQVSRLSIIGIVRDLSCLTNLDSSTLSTLERNIINFNDYDLRQIYEILRYRINLSLKPNAISDDIIQNISEIVKDNGDIRYGLNLIWRACKIAESQGLLELNMESVRLANQDMIPFSIQDVLKYLPSQKLLLLLSIIKSIEKKPDNETSITEILNVYKITCENLNSKPRSYSQLWNYLQELKNENVVSIKVESKGGRGRKSRIGIPFFSLQVLENLTNDLLKSRGLKI